MSTPVYLVLGASGGIGSVVARRLADRGARVVLAAPASDRLDALAAETGGLAHPLDATRFEDVQAAVDRAVEAHGQLDGAANLVGSILLKPGHLTSGDEFAETLQLNLWTAFHLVKAAAKAMYKTGGGIVLMSSVAAGLGLPNHEAIAAAKGGVEGLARAAAATYAPRGIRVNAVAPGLVRTPLSSRLLASEQAEEASAALHPLGRVGEPEEVAEVVDWLLDGTRSAWVTGQTIGVDGGFAKARPR
ncbi:MAG: SDR family oxidoreductase [Rubricoccaceae bacterium]|nr:SDR family oxidoreductase [Rubricoccaceae bacterium]